jgi:hypothetical protein
VLQLGLPGVLLLCCLLLLVAVSVVAQGHVATCVMTSIVLLCLSVQIPTFGFLYVAGWIGYVGRLYLNAVRRQVAAAGPDGRNLPAAVSVP